MTKATAFTSSSRRPSSVPSAVPKTLATAFQKRCGGSSTNPSHPLCSPLCTSSRIPLHVFILHATPRIVARALPRTVVRTIAAHHRCAPSPHTSLRTITAHHPSLHAVAPYCRCVRHSLFLPAETGTHLRCRCCGSGIKSCGRSFQLRTIIVIVHCQPSTCSRLTLMVSA